MKDYLFAYGTIAEDNAPQEIAGAVRQLKYVGDGFIFGRLYDLGECPGAVLQHSRHHKIFGKIFEVPAGSTALARLDAYEGFNPYRPSESLFVRRRTAIGRPKQRTLRGWVYEYTRPIESLPMIENGRYSKVSV
jgi:gamma-glutamylcyclotransferase (GGCT)/AIG2-like uncharacterized protein YtfP